jgi:hypothetical protein
MHHSFRTQAPGEGGKADDVQPETVLGSGLPLAPPLRKRVGSHPTCDLRPKEARARRTVHLLPSVIDQPRRAMDCRSSR